MRANRYRVIVKVLCQNCQHKVSTKKKIDTQCRLCRYLKYNNVTNLIKFTDFLNVNFSCWIWFNVYEYMKEENGKKLRSFVKGKNEPQQKSL